MGYFRFHRALKILPGLRLNLSKSGVSASIGPRGLKYTIGRGGARLTAGLPGSGLSYTDYKRYPQAPAGRHLFRNFLLWLTVIVIGFAVVVALLSAPARAASNEDCKTFVFLDIATIHATEECNIDFMDDPGVVRIVNTMAATKCPGPPRQGRSSRTSGKGVGRAGSSSQNFG